TPWGQCSVSCGMGLQSRYRFCSSPQSSGSGLSCLGPHREDQVCSTAPCDHPGCHVDGGWSRWGDWTECSLPCGGGVQFRRRQCDNPSPQSGGRGCLGVAQQQRDCNTHLCTGSPVWPDTFILTMPLCPSSPCGGLNRQSKACNTQVCLGEWNCSLKNCPVDGVDGDWTPWSVWSDCSVTCGRGTQVRTHACINPPPRNNGSDCSGPERETQDCRTAPCLGLFTNVMLFSFIHKLSGLLPRLIQYVRKKNVSKTDDLCPWTPWSPCSRSCGAGSVSRRRVCECEAGGEAACPAEIEAERDREETQLCYKPVFRCQGVYAWLLLPTGESFICLHYVFSSVWRISYVQSTFTLLL
uniref:Uncharacterized protein n=1 Tax=Mola mola TaxID=94237 RepID=A0A3Q4ARY0_MOLML